MTPLLGRVRTLYERGHGIAAPPLVSEHCETSEAELRPAAVLVAMTDRPDPGVLMLHRPSNMRAHPGQVALPGGKIDRDETPVEAALREAYEELGIHYSDVTVIGTSDVYRTYSGYSITPVLGVVPADISITPNPTEVAQWFEAPLAHVLNPANHVERSASWQGTARDYYEIMWQDHRIWGVTAGLIVNLSRRLRWHD